MADRFLGIDVGAETLKVVELTLQGTTLQWTGRKRVEHNKSLEFRVPEILAAFGWDSLKGAAVTGRLGRMVNLPRVPLKLAQSRGHRFLRGDEPATVVSIGGHGFSVLERRADQSEVFRENSRCSQGTGNFLRQLVQRFGLDIEEASRLCEGVLDPAPLSGRCPVILKTDMTHLANKGESRGRILAGLYDAVAENVQVLIKPRVSPKTVTLIGGVSRSRRIRDHFARFLDRHGMSLTPAEDDDLFYEALGAALVAVDRPLPLPILSRVLTQGHPTELELLPALAGSLARVKRLTEDSAPSLSGAGALILGLDIGSTGSKIVALDVMTGEGLWHGYRNTNGDPVGAAQALVQQFLDSPLSGRKVVALGTTGSGREVAGSLMTSCYGSGAVFILNEIAAHAAGALHYDQRVDTIFEIGGQDAKYIRLAEGRVIDAAMNEACSAGTGSFIEEQGRRFEGVTDVVQLGEAALKAGQGVSLGQHCSVFMAEVIDEAVATGIDQKTIIAGIYDSVVQNYLNRVKGTRCVGQVVFCQGMPFAAPALAAAVARQTGCEVIVPPHPGTVGALGIALLAHRELALEKLPALDLRKFLTAEVEGKDTFVCQSTKGCGGAGNKCRIDRLMATVEGERNPFTWGGACSLYDRGTRKKKLPDRAPDPFREREELVSVITRRMTEGRGKPRIALTDEFVLKGLFPFFITFLHDIGLDPVVPPGADQAALKRGIEEANIPFCAPMQQFHGLVSGMAEEVPDFLFLPMMRTLTRSGDEPYAVSCPVSQGNPDILAWDLPQEIRPRIVSPVIDIGPGNFESPEFIRSCRRLAESLGISEKIWQAALENARTEQTRFQERCLELGRNALAFCAAREIIPVVVLGRIYTIYNTVLNSNVPSILREQGAMPIPVDCYPLEDGVPAFQDIYWGHAQYSLRAAHQVRRSPGVYSLFCSNYSCGPDSFVIPFYAYMMSGKPFAVIETDGHSGDAGTKTRVEAFLYCVREDLTGHHKAVPANSLETFEAQKPKLLEIRDAEEILLVPYMSAITECLAASFRSLGVRAEGLGVPDREALNLGRRHTSGKECIPMVLTLGGVLQRIGREPDPGQRFAVLMPTASGPCRLGVYHLLQKIIMERIDLAGRVRFWSPRDREYFQDAGGGFSALAIGSMIAVGLLDQALYDVRPREKTPGEAKRIRHRFAAELYAITEEEGRKKVSPSRAILETISGRIFGFPELLRRASREFAAVRENRDLPVVAVTGEIYVRCDPFACDFLIDKLEERGLAVHFAHASEWFEYTSDLSLIRMENPPLAKRVAVMIQHSIHNQLWKVMAGPLGWGRRTTAEQAVTAAEPYIRRDLYGEGPLTIGGPLHEWQRGEIHGVISVGPLECLHNKVAEAQFHHIPGLPSLTIPVNGSPIDIEVLDNFVYEVRALFDEREQSRARTRRTKAPRRRTTLLRLPGIAQTRPDLNA